jgi:hypothetical protein
MEQQTRVNFAHTENKQATAFDLSKPGTAGKLIYNKKEVIGDYIFRLDRIRKHLMVSHAFDPLRLIFMTELNKIRSVSIKKIYRDIKSSHLRTKRLDDFLESVHLYFDFFEEMHSIHLPLFERNLSSGVNLPVLETRAKNWYKLLSGLLRNQNGIRGGVRLLPLPLEVKCSPCRSLTSR